MATRFLEVKTLLLCILTCSFVHAEEYTLKRDSFLAVNLGKLRQNVETELPFEILLKYIKSVYITGNIEDLSPHLQLGKSPAEANECKKALKLLSEISTVFPVDFLNISVEVYENPLVEEGGRAFPIKVLGSFVVEGIINEKPFTETLYFAKKEGLWVFVIRVPKSKSAGNLKIQ